MNEEEVSLGTGKGPVGPTESFLPSQSEEVGSSLLQDVLAAGASDADILDALLKASADQLMPWQNCDLPSRGLYYGWTSGTIEVRPWGVNVDKILATPRLAQTGQSIDYMLKHCCRFPEGFDTQDLLVGDQVFLLYYLRGITHGNNYEFAVHCANQSCQAMSTHSVDLNELASTIVWADEALGPEPFRIDLPYLSRRLGKTFWVGIRFLRVRDMQSIARSQKATNRLTKGSRARLKKRGPPAQTQHSEGEEIPIDESLTQNLERVIVSVMGVTDRFKINALLASNKLHSSDLATIREWLADHSPAIQTQVDLTCPECQSEFPVMLPITETFFRPQEPRGVREGV